MIWASAGIGVISPIANNKDKSSIESDHSRISDWILEKSEPKNIGTKPVGLIMSYYPKY